MDNKEKLSTNHINIEDLDLSIKMTKSNHVNPKNKVCSAELQPQTPPRINCTKLNKKYSLQIVEASLPKRRKKSKLNSNVKVDSVELQPETPTPDDSKTDRNLFGSILFKKRKSNKKNTYKNYEETLNSSEQIDGGKLQPQTPSESIAIKKHIKQKNICSRNCNNEQLHKITEKGDSKSHLHNDKHSKLNINKKLFTSININKLNISPKKRSSEKHKIKFKKCNLTPKNKKWKDSSSEIDYIQMCLIKSALKNKSKPSQTTNTESIESLTKSNETHDGKHYREMMKKYIKKYKKKMKDIKELQNIQSTLIEKAMNDIGKSSLKTVNEPFKPHSTKALTAKMSLKADQNYLINKRKSREDTRNMEDLKLKLMQSALNNYGHSKKKVLKENKKNDRKHKRHKYNKDIQ